jgi:antitoxin PrlF
MQRAPESKITAKGQATIPKAVRDHLNLRPGDSVKFFLGPDGRVAILPKIPTSSLYGSVRSRLGRPATLAEMKSAPIEGAVERYRRS